MNNNLLGLFLIILILTLIIIWVNDISFKQTEQMNSYKHKTLNKQEELCKQALLVIDMQNDFVLPTGSLYVKDAGDIIPGIQKQILNQKFYHLTVFSQDWHPKQHVSFIPEGGPFPPHCIQNTFGAEIVKPLDYHNLNQTAVKKGYTHDLDAFSAFHSINNTVSSGLDMILKVEGINTVYICGVATEFCVYFTAIDALELGYTVYVIIDLTKPFADASTAIADMVAKGAILINSCDLPN